MSYLNKLFGGKRYDPPKSKSHIDFKKIKGGRVLVIRKIPGKKAKFLANLDSMEMARAKYGDQK